MIKQVNQQFGVSSICYTLSINEAEVIKQLIIDILYAYGDTTNLYPKNDKQVANSKKFSKHNPNPTQLFLLERLRILNDKMFGDIQTREECEAILFNPDIPLESKESINSNK
jgi:hypothetical protein